MTDDVRIGLLVGRERSFPDALIAAINGRDAGVRCEYVRLSGTAMGEVPPYVVLVDRISHEIPYYATFLKTAALAGSVVVNNPFWRAADDKFFGASLITRLGLASPRTVALPSQHHSEGIVNESLRNLVYPLDWQAIIHYTGMPAVLKPHWGGGWKDVSVVHSLEELWAAYNRSGTQAMILQEFIAWDQYVRCICIGQEQIMPIRYDPHAPFHQRYVIDHAHLSPALGARVVHEARLINQAMGYDMNTVEFAIRDGVPYAIDFMNTAPDFDRVSLPPIYFDWVVDQMATMLIGRAKAAPTVPAPHWRAMLQTLPPLRA
ncbi:MAG: ATP-grasp domain-containing protein [Oscillochloridaceae bacterium umkhey_bin13]